MLDRIRLRHLLNKAQEMLAIAVGLTNNPLERRWPGERLWKLQRTLQAGWQQHADSSLIVLGSVSIRRHRCLR